MQPLFDAVVLKVTQQMGKAIELYRSGGVIGLLLGVTVSILTLRIRRSGAAHPQQTDLK